jgi:hypothetical protein
MGLLDIQCKETSMSENKGHSDKNPSYPELDDMGSAASRAGQSAGNQQSAGGQQDIGNQQSGNLQGSNPQNDQQSGSKQQGSQQQGQQGGQQQGQSQQHGGQHASGGTPALDDLNSKQGNSQSASQNDALQTDWDNLQDKHR